MVRLPALRACLSPLLFGAACLAPVFSPARAAVFFGFGAPFYYPPPVYYPPPAYYPPPPVYYPPPVLYAPQPWSTPPSRTPVPAMQRPVTPDAISAPCRSRSLPVALVGARTMQAAARTGRAS